MTEEQKKKRYVHRTVPLGELEDMAQQLADVLNELEEEGLEVHLLHQFNERGYLVIGRHPNTLIESALMGLGIPVPQGEEPAGTSKPEMHKDLSRLFHMWYHAGDHAPRDKPEVLYDIIKRLFHQTPLEDVRVVKDNAEELVSAHREESCVRGEECGFLVRLDTVAEELEKYIQNNLQ